LLDMSKDAIALRWCSCQSAWKTGSQKTTGASRERVRRTGRFGELGLRASDTSEHRPAVVSPRGVLLKIYIYGYLNRVASSRRLERECQRNIELTWLTGRIAPDFKTISDFRHDNAAAIRKVVARFVALCRELKLFAQAAVAIRGEPSGARIQHEARDLDPGYAQNDESDQRDGRVSPSSCVFTRSARALRLQTGINAITSCWIARSPLTRTPSSYCFAHSRFHSLGRKRTSARTKSHLRTQRTRAN
jgi:transposase